MSVPATDLAHFSNPLDDSQDFEPQALEGRQLLAV